MSQEILYYITKGNNNKKHILYLDKSEFNVIKVFTKTMLELKINTLKPLAVLITEEGQITEVLPIVGDTAILVLTKTNRNIHELTQNLPEVTNPIFFRSELDPIDTLYETLLLVQRLQD